MKMNNLLKVVKAIQIQITIKGIRMMDEMRTIDHDHVDFYDFIHDLMYFIK